MGLLQMVLLALCYLVMVVTLFVATLFTIKHNSLTRCAIALILAITVVLATMFLLANVISYFIVGLLMFWLSAL